MRMAEPLTLPCGQQLPNRLCKAAMTEGLWLDMLVNPRSMSRKQAKQTSGAYLAHLFPRHFSAAGARAESP